MGRVFIFAATFFCGKQSHPKTQSDIQFPIFVYSILFTCAWAGPGLSAFRMALQFIVDVLLKIEK